MGCGGQSAAKANKRSAKRRKAIDGRERKKKKVRFERNKGPADPEGYVPLWLRESVVISLASTVAQVYEQLTRDSGDPDNGRYSQQRLLYLTRYANPTTQDSLCEELRAKCSEEGFNKWMFYFRNYVGLLQAVRAAASYALQNLSYLHVKHLYVMMGAVVLAFVKFTCGDKLDFETREERNSVWLVKYVSTLSSCSRAEMWEMEREVLRALDFRLLSFFAGASVPQISVQQ